MMLLPGVSVPPNPRCSELSSQVMNSEYKQRDSNGGSVSVCVVELPGHELCERERRSELKQGEEG